MPACHRTAGARSLLLIGMLLLFTGTVAGTLEIHDGVTTYVDDNRLVFDLGDTQRDHMILENDTATVDGVGFSLFASDQTNITMNRIRRFVSPETAAVRFTTTAPSDTDGTVTVTGLMPGASYRIEADGVEVDTRETDDTGDLQFATTALANTQFDIIRTAVNMSSVTRETVRLQLGDQRTDYLVLYNDGDDATSFEIRVEPVINDDGTMTAAFTVDGRETDDAVVTVGANDVRAIPVKYRAASCNSGTTCTGGATFTVRDLDSRTVETTEVNLFIERDRETHQAPGISGIQLLAIIAFAAWLVAGRQRRSG